MDLITMTRELWELIGDRRISVNVATVDNRITFSIIKKWRTKRFTGKNMLDLLSQVRDYLQV